MKFHNKGLLVFSKTELNHMNQDTDKDGMNQALQHELIAIEQYSRPNRSAIDHVLNRVLCFDHFYYKRAPFRIASCDLKGC